MSRLAEAASAFWSRLRGRSDDRERFAERRYNVLEGLPDGCFIVDNDWRFTHVNERAERLLRRDAAQLIGRTLTSVLDPLASELLPEMREVRESGTGTERLQYFHTTHAWIEIRIRPAADEMLVYLRDVTERKTSEALLRESERRVRLLLHQVPAILWTVDLDLRFSSVVGTGLSSQDLKEERLLGQPFERILDRPDTTIDKIDAIRAVFDGESQRFEARRGERWLQHHVEPLRDAAGDIVGAIGVALDVTEIKEGADHLAKLARQDAMTGLPNRLALEETLPEMLAEAGARNETVAVLFIDLDRFKTINDTLGHRVGDELLRAVSARLRSRISENDLIFRPGGDEFIVVLRHMRNGSMAQAVAARILASLTEQFIIENREMFVSASIGTSLFPDNGATPEELLKQADSAMYRAKESGRNNVKVYDGSMHEKAVQRLRLEQDLRQALQRGELRLQYQPIIDTHTGKITAAEALLRWDHPEFGEVQPEKFISLAEETGSIVDISRWVLRTACEQAARSRELGHRKFRIAVNLSARDFYEPDLPQSVAAALALSGITPDALDIEVTESIVLNGMAIKTLAAIREMGIRIIVDDFGIGYSSLSYIKSLPISAIKIDRSFIRDVTRNSYDQAIVRAIATLAQSLDFTVIAEGVESAGQHDFLKTVFCGEAQGFHFSRPIAAAELEAALAEGSGTPGGSTEAVAV